MINGKTVAVVVPAYNEETQIGIVIETMPDFVDRIIIVNDASTDNMESIVKNYIQLENENVVREKHAISWKDEEIIPNRFNRAEIVAQEILKEENELFHPHDIYNDNLLDRIVLINNKQNGKLGKSLSVGFKWCRDHGIDCTAVMDGDAQMDPSELYGMCIPIIEEEIDYVKGNRLSHPSAKKLIPRKRYFGNSVLSALTKLASGYWHVSDTQTGYRAISLRALKAVKLYGIYRTYGQANDLLIKLNMANCTVKEIPIKPVYAVGEKSKMKILKVIPTVSMLLLKGFFKRITYKYFVQDFHPIFFFYLISWITFATTIYFLGYIIVDLPTNEVTVGTYMGFITSLVSTFLSFGFAMWLDVYENEKLWKE